jgi:hypothetical protein
MAQLKLDSQRQLRKAYQFTSCPELGASNRHDHHLSSLAWQRAAERLRGPAALTEEARGPRDRLLDKV